MQKSKKELLISKIFIFPLNLMLLVSTCFIEQIQVSSSIWNKGFCISQAVYLLPFVPSLPIYQRCSAMFLSSIYI